MIHHPVVARALCIGLLACATTIAAFGFNASNYASTSKLASGKWVKISVAESGVYQLTSDELKAMGFSSPEKVRVYGRGGNVLSEVLDGKAPDDLTMVPVAKYGDKICFYGRGPLTAEIADPRTKVPHYTRKINPYATRGCYFLTEEAGTEDTIETAPTSLTMGTMPRATSLDYCLHEQELTSPGSSGKTLLGEDIASAETSFGFKLPGLVSGTPVLAYTSVGAKVSALANIYTYIDMGGYTDTVAYSSTTNRIYASTSTTVYYNSATTLGQVTPRGHSETGKVRLGISTTGQVTNANLDYVMLTYYHSNAIPRGQSQVRMGFANLTDTDRIELQDVAGGNLVVWNIDDPAAPKRCDYTTYVIADSTAAAGTTIVHGFTPGQDLRSSQYIAFNPQDTLMCISGWEAVDNQNIHGEATPHMVIVTCKPFMQQAQRIANMHAKVDGWRVLVVDQEKVFNEFSSGTPDAMAIRLMNKMFYDRDKSTFRYLLLLGCGTYDNRSLVSKKANTVLTYESDNSSDESYSYVCDDFYGMLDDNSGSNMTTSALRLGVGRIPSATVDEATSDVDKLLNYVENPDYGPWRDNAMFWADDIQFSENTLHVFQAEGALQLINQELGVGFNTDRAYVSMYPVATELAEPGQSAETYTAVEAKRHISQMFNTGQYFATYVGHAGPISFGRSSHLWTQTDAEHCVNEHLPIMTTACCDIARYDSETRGVGEIMFHKPDGGVIAMITSARTVNASDNDALNRLFINAMFAFGKTGQYPRIGDAYMACKQPVGRTSSYNLNKMSFLLLGDPAIKVNYPKPYFKISKIDGRNITESTGFSIMPLRTITVEAKVMKSDLKSVDTSFNGDGYFTLYDRETRYIQATQNFNGTKTTRDVYYPRNMLAQVKGRVVKGVMTAKITIPRYVESVTGTTGLISFYAHQDNSSTMVNGRYTKLLIDTYAPTGAIVDNEPPVVHDMYFNDAADAAESVLVPSNSTLYINVSDNVAVNTQKGGVGTSMNLKLDGGKTSYMLVKDYAVATNNGKNVNIAFPMTGLESGTHTLTFEVCDVACNKTSRTITFTVGEASQAAISTRESVVSDQVVFELKSETAVTPSMTLKVTDSSGNLVYTKPGCTFPWTWDLTTKSGQRLKPARYRYYGTYEAGNHYGGTAIGTFTVLEKQK